MLYSETPRTQTNNTVAKELEEPEIMKGKVENVLKIIKNGKAPGSDVLSVELLKLFDDDNLSLLVIKNFNQMYDSGNTPHKNSTYSEHVKSFLLFKFSSSNV